MKESGKHVRMAAACFALLLTGLLSACGTKEAEVENGVPVVLDQAEYVLYQNIFYNDYGGQYEGTQVKKHGVFTTVQDAFNDRTRYYVWGYMDNTKCCDWQWELVPEDGAELPPDGSLVDVEGTFASSADALDGYWIENAGIIPELDPGSDTAEINMCTMSCTLERVQMLNILYHPEAFGGKSFNAYGRIAGEGVLEDPYYDGSWQIDFSAGAELPAIGTTVSLTGTVGDGMLDNCTLKILE